MKRKQSFPALYERLKKAFKSPSERTFRKRIERKARSLGLPNTFEALFVLAREKGVGYLREFSHLSIDQQNRITQAIRGSNASTIPTIRGRSKIKEHILRTPFGSIHDPFLPEKVVREAKMMSEKAYPYLYILENSLRNFIILILENKFGKKNWWNAKMNTKRLKEISERVKDRMKEEQRHSFHGKRGAHPIYYSDFGHLIEILKAHKSIFNGYFSNLEGKLDGFITKLREIEPSRNVTAHHNPLTERDINRVVGYLLDWLGQLKYLKDNNLL